MAAVFETRPLFKNPEPPAVKRKVESGESPHEIQATIERRKKAGRSIARSNRAG